MEIKGKKVINYSTIEEQFSNLKLNEIIEPKVGTSTDKVGNGFNGEVYRYTMIKDDQPISVVCKSIISKQVENAERMFKALKNEISIINRIKKYEKEGAEFLKYVVKFYGIKEGKIVMEDLTEQGYETLAAFDKKSLNSLEKTALKKVLQKAVTNLNKNKIAHCDLHDKNIMIKKLNNTLEPEFAVKLIDFGKSKFREKLAKKETEQFKVRVHSFI